MEIYYEISRFKRRWLKVLVAKQYIIPFDSGVIVIKHWRINNLLRKDRYNETKYQIEMSQLYTDENMVYQRLTSGCHNIEENSIEKNSIDKYRKDKSMREEKPFDDVIKEVFGDSNVWWIDENFKWKSNTIWIYKNRRIKKNYTEEEILNAYRNSNVKKINYITKVLETNKSKKE